MKSRSLMTAERDCQRRTRRWSQKVGDALLGAEWRFEASPGGWAKGGHLLRSRRPCALWCVRVSGSVPDQLCRVSWPRVRLQTRSALRESATAARQFGAGTVPGFRGSGGIFRDKSGN